MDVFFSVIIPVYNTPMDLLFRCLDSINKQTYQQYEIIIVDDGSESETAEKLDCITDKYLNITVYHIANKGVSYARNYGVSKAKGEWIIFVDSDDIIAPYMLAQSWKIIKDHPDIDIIYGYVKYIREFSCNDINLISNDTFKILDDKNKKALLKHMIALEGDEFKNDDGSYISRGPVARVISLKTIKHNNFLEGIPLSEDLLWNIKMLKNKPNAVIINSVWYLYILNPNSATKRYRENVVAEEKIFLNKLFELIQYDCSLYTSSLLKTLECIHEIMETHYLHKEYKNTKKQANCEFLEAVNDEAFNRFLKWKYIKRLKIKALIRMWLFFATPYPVTMYYAYDRIKKILR